MFWRRMGPEEARVRLVLLREGVRQKVGALEARLAKRKAPLEKALKEYRGVLEHLRRLEAEGRYPEAVLRPALAREELRIRYAEGEIARLEEAHRQADELDPARDPDRRPWRCGHAPDRSHRIRNSGACRDPGRR